MPKGMPRSIRLDSMLLEHLGNLARAQHRSVNNLIATILQAYIEEHQLLADPEFQRALKEAETDEGIPWRNGMKLV